MEQLRNSLKLINMKAISEKAGVSYDVLKNFSSGRKKYLTEEEFNNIINAIRNII